MSPDNSSSGMRSVATYFARFIFILCGVVAVSNRSLAADNVKINTGGSGEGFAIVGVNGHESGSNSVWVWLSGSIRIGRSDTVNDSGLSGVGIFDAALSPDDQQLVRRIHRQLCEAVTAGPKSEMPPISPPTIYVVDCARDGKLAHHEGRTFELTRTLNSELVDFFMRTRDSYLPRSRAVVRLDVEVANVERVSGKFMVSIRFVNGGQYPIQMETPDKWANEMGYQLGFGGENEEDQTGWGGGNLAGLPLVNKSEFPADTVVIPAHGSVTFKFPTRPKNKFGRGTYAFNASVNAYVSTSGTVPALGRVVFHSDYSKPTRILFDRDYPSSPDEWTDYEARRRAQMSSLPVRPGAVIAEAGYYRAVAAGGERGQFVEGLLRGEKAPVLDHPFERWEWDADLALPANCKAGEPCPREGRWVPRTTMMYSGDRRVMHPEFERHMRTGEITPNLGSLGGIEPYHYWQWLGA